jgi:hypothetical protein
MCCGKNREALRRSLAQSLLEAQSRAAQMATEARPSAPDTLARTTMTAVPTASEAAVPTPSAPPLPSPQGEEVVFESQGKNAFVAIGGDTGRRYHFAGPGARVRADARDRDLLAMIDGLVEVGERDAGV